MVAALRGISSMATRQVLADLAAAWQAAGGEPVVIESVGGVDAARRIAGGEPFDLAVLAADALGQLVDAGRVVADSVVALMRSEVAIAVREGASPPDVGSEAALRRTVLAAASIGYSTGPSGTALLRLFERWGIADAVRARTIQAPPGVPVGALIARGEVAIGFQQASELRGLPGVTVLGEMPEPVRITTVFAGGVVTGSARAAAVRRLLADLAGPRAAAILGRHGMAPA